MSGEHEHVPVIKPVYGLGNYRTYHLPEGQVLTWYPADKPTLPSNEGIHEQSIDLGNTQVLPMPTNEADIKAQGFSLKVGLV